MINAEESLKQIGDWEAKLIPFAESRRSVVVVFAGRQALRVLPLLAINGNFDYWPQSHRAQFLLSFWTLGLYSATFSDEFITDSATADVGQLNLSWIDAILELAVAGSVSAYKFSQSNRSAAANSVASSVEAFLAAHSAVKAGDAIQAARAAAITARCASIAKRTAAKAESIEGDIGSDGTDQIDLQLIELAEQFDVSLPLFQWVRVGSGFQQYLDRLYNAIRQLQSEWADDPVLMDLIGEIPILYRRLLDGGISNQEVNFNIESIYRYLESTKNAQAPSGVEDSAEARIAESTDTTNIADSESKTEVDKNKSFIFEFEPTREQCPEATSKEDHLNRLDLVNALARILADPVNDHHQTIGLLGEWGSGKSTWLGFLTEALINNDKKQPFIFGSFNAWAYEHTENLQAGIAHEVIKALVTAPKGKNWLARWWWGWKLKSHVAVALHGWPTMFGLLIKFLAAIVPFSLVASLILPELAAMLGADAAPAATTSAAPAATAVSSTSATAASNAIATKPNFLAGIATLGAGFIATLVLIQKTCFEQWKAIWASPEAKELLTYLKLPDYAKHLGEIPVMRKTLEKFCAVRLKQVDQHNCRLLFVVDDLDRCSHQGIVKVFEAVRLVLDIPNVMVIIAVDQHIALAALALHYKELAEHHKLGNARAIARDYLAKVIHLPIILGKPQSKDIRNYLEKIWEKTAPPAAAPASGRQQLIRLASPQVQSRVQPALATSVSGNSPASSLQSDSSPSNDNLPGNVNTAPEGTLTPSNPAGESSGQPQQEIKKIIGLNEDQQEAFFYWANYFALTNPRQLKRLNNTYTLLLNAYRSWDKQSVEVSFDNAEKKIFFPVLIGLITLEYLNALDDPRLRQQLKAQIKTATGQHISHSLINEPFRQMFDKLENAFEEQENKSAERGQTAIISLLQTLEPFVLPAIECDTKPDQKQTDVAPTAAQN